ncbi:MAG: hypothetical protein GEV11_28190 [Streptosporangiales bacterium]|nr:hypothetical protein [Streptosporangiales bacterium]
MSKEGRRERLWQVAAIQRGYFTAKQALDAGYSYPVQHYHREQGHWRRIDHGIYRFREYLDLPGEDTDHFVRWSLWSRDRAVVSHTSALAAHDLGIANPATIHLTVPPHFRKNHHAVSLHRASLTPDEIEHHEGFRVTTPTRAIAETAAARMDQDILDSAVNWFLGAAHTDTDIDDALSRTDEAFATLKA